MSCPRLSVLFAAVALVAGCSGSTSNGGTDAGAAVDCSVDAGPIDYCNPGPCVVGNDKGVGQYCSPGGDECNPLNQQYGGAYGCSIDLDPQGSTFCVRLFCKTNEECGEDACCTGRGSAGPKACVPRECVVDHPNDPCPAIETTDGGSSDDDGGTADTDGGAGDSDGGT